MRRQPSVLPIVLIQLTLLIVGVPANSQTATSLDGGGSNPDVRFDSTGGCWFIDEDADASRDSGEPCIEDESIRFARDFASGSATAGINEAIADCGKNASGQGCHVWLPAGEVLIDETVQIGGLSGDDQQYGITLHGHGNGTVDSVGNQRCGTILRTGSGFSSHDPMIAVDGSIAWRLQDFCMEGDTNGKVAGWGILIRGDNTPEGCCANNHHGDIEFVSIRDVTGAPGIGIAIAGNDDDSQPGSLAEDEHNDQVDFITISHTSVRDSKECFRQDSKNAVSNHLQVFECSKWTGTYGVVVLQGGMIFDDLYIGANQSDQTGLYWESAAIRMEANNLTFEWGGDDGTFVHFAGRGNQNVATIRGSRFQSQYTASSGHTFVRFDRRGTLNLIGNRFFVGSGSMGDFEIDSSDTSVPTYVNFIGNEYMCSTNSTDCEPTIDATNSGGGEFPSGGVRVTRQEEGVFRVYDELGSIPPATTYQFYGEGLDSTQVGRCLRTDAFDLPQSCGSSNSVATTAVLAPSRPRIGALMCSGPMAGSGDLDLAVRFRDGSSTTDSDVSSQLTRGSAAAAASVSWSQVSETSPYQNGLVSVVLKSASGTVSGDLVCQLEVFH